MTEDIDINVDKSKGDSSESTSGGGKGGGGHRTTVTVKGEYGTNQYPPDTECEVCGSRAVGVFVPGNGGLANPIPFCGEHRDGLKEGEPGVWERGEFRRFVD